jgi:hypothetical protein
MMERIINADLLNCLLSDKLITKQQHGLIHRCCTCTDILESLQDWCLYLQAYTVTDAIYFDFKKAFDSVLHSKLLLKLSAYGFSGNLLSWVTEFLHNRLQLVKLYNLYSHVVPVISGVSRGSVLRLTLFLLFIRDFSDVFGNLNIKFKLYADDIQLSSCYEASGVENYLVEAVNC